MYNMHHQATATHCNTLHHTAPHCTTLHHTAAHYNTLQHAATKLQHAATHNYLLASPATTASPSTGTNIRAAPFTEKHVPVGAAALEGKEAPSRKRSPMRLGEWEFSKMSFTVM